MVKTKYVSRCQECGYISPKWLGKCPDCGQFNTFVEEISDDSSPVKERWQVSGSPPTKISEVSSFPQDRYSTKIKEFDRVLGGGVVPGSLVLIGGEPGIGKSTLLLQALGKIAQEGKKVMLVSGEESVQQIRLRADRTEALSENLLVMTETNLTYVEKQILELDPWLVVIDSIQTMFLPDVTSAPGSVSQVRESTAHLLRISKKRNLAIFIVGHVTKDGSLAGPRVLEHIVDTVLYFEGDSYRSYRLVRAVKNRFGSTNEIGVFEMREKGLFEVGNPSEIFLAERGDSSGSVVAAIMEGTRPVLVEVQALVSNSYLANPRRHTSGLDFNRLAINIAVLEKRVGLSLESRDIYINIAGGVRATEPAIDLATALAISSAHKDLKVPRDTAVFGEIGLGGEVRGVSHRNQRVSEAQKLGFRRIIGPSLGLEERDEKRHQVELIEVKSVGKALEYLQ